MNYIVIAHERILVHQFDNSIMQANVVRMNGLNIRSQGNNKNSSRNGNSNIGSSGS